MASQVRPSPLGIFCVICVVFIILYSGRYYFFPGETIIEDINLQIEQASEGNINDEEVSLQKLLEASIFFAEKGGAQLKKIREEDDLKQKSKGLTKEGVVEAVTEGDMQSHKAIVHGLKQMFPSVQVASEEHETTTQTNSNVVHTSQVLSITEDLFNKKETMVPIKDVLVWVDPLDATKEYTENLLEYVTTMVCIVVNNVPVAGVIHQPFLPKTSWVWVEHGNSKQLSKPTDKSSLVDPRIIVSRSHAGPVNKTAIAAFGNKVEIIPAGGSGFKVLSLFNNKADAYIHTTLIKKWDICAGNALLQAFGGKMTTLRGKEILYGDKNDDKHEGGLLATLNNHEDFLKKLSAAE